MKTNPLRDLLDCGQSFWMDTISRPMIQDGTLKRMIKEDGLRGVTSNPDIFQKAIAGSNLYDDQIRKLALAGKSTVEIYEALAVADIQKAADVLRPVYDASGGEDGLISLEVSPYLAFDTKGTIDEAHRLWEAVGRKNVFIKVPATPPGLSAIRQLIADGINVNVTLIFSLDAYAKVMEAYIAGLEDRAKQNLPLGGIVSVASFFVSRIDVLVDKLLGNRIVENLPKGMPPPQQYLGKAAIACAKIAYQDFKETFGSSRFAALKKAGARVQRPLWASTSSKNPLYPDTVYVEPLIGSDTVNTMPMATIEAWRDHGNVRCNTIEEGIEEARTLLKNLKKIGIDLTGATWQVLEEGVSKFNQPFDKLLTSIAQKRAALLGWSVESQQESLGKAGKEIAGILEALSEARFGSRLYGKDPSLYSTDPKDYPTITNRLGWIDAPEQMQTRLPEVIDFAADVKRAKFRHVVLLGMGGSSLCPEVCAKTFARSGYPELVVLDTTSPEYILEATSRLDLQRSLFIVASKSGGTIETMSLFHYFWDQLKAAGAARPGDNFIAITDPNTSLSKLAKQRKFRKVFENPADIGGRYSALSLFGLVPMALLGIDVKKLLARTVAFAQDGKSLMPASADPAIRLGVTLAALAQQGRDKMTLILSPRLESLGSWIEQLVAESTGKQGRGILPVDLEKLGSPAVYSKDRVFVSVALAGDKVDSARLKALEESGAPVVRIQVADPIDLGVEFYRWEIATATAGVILGINPFDEPNVSESKAITSDILGEYRKAGQLALPAPDVEDGEITLTLSSAARAGSKKGSSLKDVLGRLVASIGEGDYLAISAFLPPTEKYVSRLAAVRNTLRDSTKRATTLGFGPRYLHSTGQLHKGGANNGVFIVLMSQPTKDADIPGEDISFGAIIQGQAIGDYRALDNHDRRAVLINLGSNVEAGLKQLGAALSGKK